MPQIAGEYFQIGTPPAHGLYARNVRGLTLDNVRFETATPDLRPAVVLDGVTDAVFSNFTTGGNPDASSVIRAIDTTDTLISAARLKSPAAVYLAVEGERSADITVDGGNIHRAEKSVTFAQGATEKAAKVRT